MASTDEKASTSWKNYAIFYAYKLMCIFMKMTDIRIVAVFGRLIGYLVWAVTPRRRRIVARNLRIVIDPTLRPNKLSAMVRRNMVRTTMNLVCSLKTGLMKQSEMERFIHVDGGELFEEHGSNGHTVISCIPHAGNWEILARIRPLFSNVARFGSMYRKLANPLLEDFIYKSRTRYGCEMFSKEEGFREVMKLARSGGLLGVLSDQFTAEGVYLPYFGKVTGVTPLPAILYKRCKGKGYLHAVFTRNTSLGHWDAVLDRVIELPENCDSLPAITMQVNLALEKCQKENILDGFWMHHRWKASYKFVPEMDDDTRTAIETYSRLPFRIIISMPEDMEQAKMLKNAVYAFATCRPDAQVCVLCTSAQAAYWREQKGAAHVIATDGKVSVSKQLDAEEVYRDGPFDVLIMLGGGKRLLRELRSLSPLYIIGWEDHPLAHKFNDTYPRHGHTGAPSFEEYERMFAFFHHVHISMD